MAITYKVLGQSNPAAITNTNLYTVPGSTSTVVSTISVANLGVSGTFRIAIRPGGAAIANQHYLSYDVGINGNDAMTFTIGVTLATTDIITVYASNTSFAFSAFGSEIT